MLSKLKRTKMVKGGTAPDMPGVVKENPTNPTRTKSKFTFKAVPEVLKNQKIATAIILALVVFGGLTWFFFIRDEQQKATDTIDLPEYTELSPELKEKLKTDLEEGPPELKGQTIPYTD